MTIANRTECPVCNRITSAIVITKQGRCGRCRQAERDIARGYALPQQGDYTCVFCGVSVKDSTFWQIAIDGKLTAADSACILANAVDYPAVAQCVADWQADLQASHLAEDAQMDG